MCQDVVPSADTALCKPLAAGNCGSVIGWEQSCHVKYVCDPFTEICCCRPKPSAAEEVLFAALQDSRRHLTQLDNIINAMAKHKEREQKQFERLHFAYKRAKGDAAYIRSCEKRLEMALQKSVQE